MPCVLSIFEVSLGQSLNANTVLDICLSQDKEHGTRQARPGAGKSNIKCCGASLSFVLQETIAGYLVKQDISRKAVRDYYMSKQTAIGWEVSNLSLDAASCLLYFRDQNLSHG